MKYSKLLLLLAISTASSHLTSHPLSKSFQYLFQQFDNKVKSIETSKKTMFADKMDVFSISKEKKALQNFDEQSQDDLFDIVMQCPQLLKFIKKQSKKAISETDKQHEPLAEHKWHEFHSNIAYSLSASARRLEFEEENGISSHALDGLSWEEWVSLKRGDLSEINKSQYDLLKQKLDIKSNKMIKYTGGKYKSFWQVLEDNPRKIVYGALVSAGLLAVYKNKSKIKKYISKKYNSAKEQLEEIQDLELEEIKDLIVGEIEEEWDRIKSEGLTRKQKCLVASGAVGLGATMYAQKKWGLLNLTKSALSNISSGFSWLDAKGIDLVKQGISFCKNNPKIIVPVAGTLTTGFLYKFFKAKSISSELEEFFGSFSNSQKEKLRNYKFTILIGNAYDNPELLLSNKEFMNILSDKQVKVLYKVIKNHKARLVKIK